MDKKTKKKLFFIPLCGILLLILINILLCPSRAHTKEVLSLVNNFQGNKQIEIIIDSNSFNSFPKKTQQSILDIFKTKYKNFIIMDTYAIQLWKNSNKNNYKNKIIFDCLYRKKFLSYTIRIGYTSGRKSGGYTQKTYYWFLGWHLWEEKKRVS